MPFPAFEDDGLLPPGTYKLTIQQLKNSHLVTGASSFYRESWDRLWRLSLIEQVEQLIKQLWEVDIYEIFLDGSFVEDKCKPGDIDGYYECRFTQYDQLTEKNAIWDIGQKTMIHGKFKPLMWARHRIELYPHFIDDWNSTGIKDEFGNDLTFPSAFRRTRENQPKGIIQIIKE